MDNIKQEIDNLDIEVENLQNKIDDMRSKKDTLYLEKFYLDNCLLDALCIKIYLNLRVGRRSDCTKEGLSRTIREILARYGVDPEVKAIPVKSSEGSK